MLPERKAPAELFIRKFARVYTPIVIGFAFLIVLIPYIYSFINPLFGFVLMIGCIKHWFFW